MNTHVIVCPGVACYVKWAVNNPAQDFCLRTEQDSDWFKLSKSVFVHLPDSAITNRLVTWLMIKSPPFQSLYWPITRHLDKVETFRPNRVGLVKSLGFCTGINKLVSTVNSRAVSTARWPYKNANLFDQTNDERLTSAPYLQSQQRSIYGREMILFGSYMRVRDLGNPRKVLIEHANFWVS